MEAGRNVSFKDRLAGSAAFLGAVLLVLAFAAACVWAIERIIQEVPAP